MKRLIAAAALSLIAGQTLAADASTPVKEIMEAAMHNAADEGEHDDYFSKERLGQLYSKAFVKTYKAAWKKQESEENGGYLLGSDPITFAQDGCPFKNLSIETMGERDGWTPVAARFEAFYCLGDSYKGQVNTVQFIVLKEKGHYVIDDIQNIVDGKVADSIKTQLEALSN
jgi:hypothetical protein